MGNAPFEKAVEAAESAYGLEEWDDPTRVMGVALTAALSALESEGWVLVPTKATPQMCEAMYELQREQETLAVLASEAYRAMLASRPKMEDGNG